jgi:hypothetical protein
MADHAPEVEDALGELAGVIGVGELAELLAAQTWPG